MRTFALIAGLAIAVAALPAAAAEAVCEKRTVAILIEDVADRLLGREEDGNKATECKRTPKFAAEPAVGHPRTEPALAHAAASCRYEAQPRYDAGGHAVYRPTRACGRF